MHSTNYVVMFVLAMCAVVALGLTTLREVTYATSVENEAIFNKRQILKAVKPLKEVDALADADVVALFAESVEQISLDANGKRLDEAFIKARGYKGGMAEHIDMKKEKKKPDPKDRIFPAFVYKDGGNTNYIVSVRGNGLWDEIWGYIALDDKMRTVVGASFDHQGETPGLGAEIKDNPDFAKRFKGKTIYNDAGEYTSVVVMKGSVKDKTYQVDGIAGATVTCVGVSEMLDRGIKKYEPFFASLKK